MTHNPNPVEVLSAEALSALERLLDSQHISLGGGFSSSALVNHDNFRSIMNALFLAARSTPPVGWVLASALDEMTAERDLLQEVLDSRPAINAGLPDSYIRWSRSVLSGDAYRVLAARPLMEGLDQGSLQATPCAPVIETEAWHPISTAPKDGSPLRIRTHDIVRWLAYKPDGARQMKKAGRWQSHDGYGWTNCADPTGPWQPADARAEPTLMEGDL